MNVTNSFSLTIRQTPGRTILALLGDFDSSNRAVFTEVLRAALTTSAITQLDLSQTGVFGSAAVASIIEARRGIDQPTLVVVSPAPHVRTVLEISQLDIAIEAKTDDLGIFTSSRTGYDRLIARSVTSGREAMCITTADLDAPGPEIVYVNPAFCSLTGYSAGEIVGQTPRLLQGALTDRVMLDRLRRQLEDGETFHGETVNYRKDGAPFFMNWKITAIDADDGRYFVAHQIDATTSVRATRQVAATALLRDAASQAPADVNRRLAEAVTSAHHMLLGTGSVGSEIVVDGTPYVAGDEIVREDSDFERAHASGPIVDDTGLNGFELVVAVSSPGVTVRAVVRGLTDDHLKLTALDDHVAIAQLAASLAERNA